MSWNDRDHAGSVINFQARPLGHGRAVDDDPRQRAVFLRAVSIRLHEAHRTHKSDLGQIDQAIWNTSQGRFVQETRDDQVLTRLTDHVEPIFAPVSLVFKVWDDVRALLVSSVDVVGHWRVAGLRDRAGSPAPPA